MTSERVWRDLMDALGEELGTDATVPPVHYSTFEEQKRLREQYDRRKGITWAFPGTSIRKELP